MSLFSRVFINKKKQASYFFEKNLRKVENCEVCNGSFHFTMNLLFTSLFLYFIKFRKNKRMHKCKRCKRYVCADCSKFKSLVLDFTNE